MDFPHIFGFFKIVNQSIKNVLKNAKCIAAITALSLLPSLIMLFIFSCIYSAAMDFLINFTENPDANYSIPQMIAYTIAVFAVELAFIFACSKIVHASGIATIVATVASYSDTTLSLRDLYSSFKATWNRPRRKFSGSRKPQHFVLIFAVAMAAAAGVAISLVMFNPNPVRIAVVNILCILIYVCSLYGSISVALASVIPVVEGCEAAEAMEKAERLVEGRRLEGFMAILLSNLVCVGAGLGVWMIVGDRGRLNLMMVHALFLVVFVSLLRIVTSVVYTVYYFQCMEYHGETVQIGNFHYTTVANDIV